MSRKNFITAFPWPEGKMDPQANAQEYLKRIGSSSHETNIFPIPINSLRVGTLDQNLEASDELVKIDAQIEGITFKILQFKQEVWEVAKKEEVASVLKGDSELTFEEYLRKWTWNEAIYPSNKPVKQIIQQIQDRVWKHEEQARTKVNEYTELKTRIINAAKRKDGNLSVKPITKQIQEFYKKKGEVNPIDTEYLTTLFVAVPKGNIKDWEASYAKMSDMVVPQSSEEIDRDSEYFLMNVILFKKVADTVKHACREKRYVIRDYTPGEVDDTDVDLTRERDTKRTTTINFLKSALTECYAGWIHLKAVRVFVEAILRYGVPPKFSAFIHTIPSNKEKELRNGLQQVAAVAIKNQRDMGDEDDTNALENKYVYISLKIAVPY